MIYADAVQSARADGGIFPPTVSKQNRRLLFSRESRGELVR